MDVWQCCISTSTKQRMTLPKHRGKYSSEKRDNKRCSWASVLSEEEELLSSPKPKKKKNEGKDAGLLVLEEPCNRTSNNPFKTSCKEKQ